MTQKSKWENEFDDKFNFFKDITITLYQESDFHKAKVLQEMYRNTGEEIKSFIRNLLTTLAQEVVQAVPEIENWKCTDMGLKSDDYVVIRKTSLTDTRTAIDEVFKKWGITLEK